MARNASAATESLDQAVVLRPVDPTDRTRLPLALAVLQRRVADSLPAARASLHDDQLLLQLPVGLSRQVATALWQRTRFLVAEIDPAAWLYSPQLRDLPGADPQETRSDEGQSMFWSMGPDMVDSPVLRAVVPNHAELKRVTHEDRLRTVAVLPATSVSGRCLSARSEQDEVGQRWLHCNLKEQDALALEHLAEPLTGRYAAIGFDPGFLSPAIVMGKLRIRDLSIPVSDETTAKVLAAALCYPLPFALCEQSECEVVGMQR